LFTATFVAGLYVGLVDTTHITTPYFPHIVSNIVAHSHTCRHTHASRLHLCFTLHTHAHPLHLHTLLHTTHIHTHLYTPTILHVYLATHTHLPTVYTHTFVLGYLLYGLRFAVPLTGLRCWFGFCTFYYTHTHTHTHFTPFPHFDIACCLLVTYICSSYMTDLWTLDFVALYILFYRITLLLLFTGCILLLLLPHTFTTPPHIHTHTHTHTTYTPTPSCLGATHTVTVCVYHFIYTLLVASHIHTDYVYTHIYVDTFVGWFHTH